MRSRELDQGQKGRTIHQHRKSRNRPTAVDASVNFIHANLQS